RRPPPPPCPRPGRRGGGAAGPGGGRGGAGGGGGGGGAGGAGAGAGGGGGEGPPWVGRLAKASWRPVSSLCTYAWWPVSQTIRSTGESRARCRAMVSATTAWVAPEAPA